VSVKSTALVYGSSPNDPYWFRETDKRVAPARTRVERSLLEVESYVRDFARDNPYVNLSLLRFSNVIGPDLATPLSRALRLPLVPKVAGYDPRFQLVHERDVVRAITFALTKQLSGTFNVAGDGQLPWSEIMAIAGRHGIPMPPIGIDAATGPLRRLGLVDLPPEIITLLTYGRGVDNRAFKAKGFDYLHTTAGAVEAFVQSLRLRKTVGKRTDYKYEDDVEQFFRHSPAVLRNQPDPS
jgi:UDP-glucose 4-epimerase